MMSGMKNNPVGKVKKGDLEAQDTLKGGSTSTRGRFLKKLPCESSGPPTNIFYYVPFRVFSRDFAV
jgi:hypothetical protein